MSYIDVLNDAAARANAASTKAEGASQLLEDIANGPVETYVTTLNGQVPTAATAIEQLRSEITAGATAPIIEAVTLSSTGQTNISFNNIQTSGLAVYIDEGSGAYRYFNFTVDGTSSIVLGDSFQAGTVVWGTSQEIGGDVQTAVDQTQANAQLAENWAILTGQTVDGVEYSSKHYAGESASSASAAASSEQNAATSESNAATSASNALDSENAAALSESNAATSEQNAAQSESNAFGYSNAAQSAAERAETAADETVEQLEGRIESAILASGYQFLGDYAAGIEITEYNQIVRDSEGEFWRVSGQVDLPYMTTGAGLPEGGAFVAVGDATLREEFLKRTPRLYQTDDIRDPELSGAIEDFQLFDMTAQEELAYQLSGQNPDASLPPLTGTILGECYFGFPTMDQTNKVASPFPRINASGVKVASAAFPGSQTIALSDIRAGTFNSSVNLPLFEPVMVDQYGIVSFRYLGEQPLHTVIRGGIQWLQRIYTGAADSTAATDAWLRLSPLPLVDRPSSGLDPSDNIPSWEAGGQARGRQYLGFCSASGAQHFPLIAEEWNDVPGQISPTVEAAIENDPELNTEPPVNGWLSSSSDDENVLDPDDPESGIPPELEGNLKTTEWVDITPGTWYRGAVLPLGESSSRGRAQWRDSEGVIHSKNLGSGNFLFQAPPDAVDFRIYYAGPQDAHVTGLSIKSVTESQIGPQIVTRGTWCRYNINVCRDVVFYPNTVYRLELKIFSSYRQEGASAGYWFEYEDGYRIESGGLSFMFDASALVKQRAALHTNKGVN